VIEDAIALGAEGLDLAIVYLPAPRPGGAGAAGEGHPRSGLWRAAD
jgi:hypothetical protein